MAIENSIIFGGVNSADFGIYISGEGVFNAPKRDVEMITIPGRNGAFALDNGRFENIEVTYPAFNFEPNDYDTFAQRLSDFRNAICAQRGYQRLEDTFHPDEYRMAAYIGGLDIKPIKYNTASEFDIVFDCKPQRWLKDGETAVTIGEWGETETVSGDIVSVENPNGILAVKSLEVDLEPIQDLNGYSKPWVGGAGKNKLPYPYTNNSGTTYGITYSTTADGRVTINGTATSTAWVRLYGGFATETSLKKPVPSWITADTNYVLSGGQSSNFYVQINLYSGTSTIGQWIDTGSGKSFSLTSEQISNADSFAVFIRVSSGQTVNATISPMIEEGSAKTSWTPYSNICPISGHDSVDTYRTGKNLANISDSENGGINANGNNVTDANNWRSTSLIPIKGGQEYTLHANGMAITRLYFYDASGTFISPRVVSQTDTVTATAPSNAVYAKWTIYKTGITSVDVQSANVQLELGSEATAYEPYQGTTYTTALGRTVYGGTLDVTSGVLTVTHAIVTFNGASAEQWEYYSVAQGNLFRHTQSDRESGALINKEVYCNRFNVVDNTNKTNGTLSSPNSGGEKYFDFIYDDCNSVATWKTWLSSNNVQVVYPLAEPQTYQLTAQQISLLTGDNNIWSDSGDIALEYGQNPSVLFNPTLFESSPFLEAEGEGLISFNGYEIDLDGVPYGEVTIGEPSYAFHTSPVTVTLDTTLLNIGDAIYPQTKDCYIRARLKKTAGYNLYLNSVSSTTNMLEVTASSHTGKKGDEFHIKLYPDFGDGFVYGTSKTITCTAVIIYRVGSNPAATPTYTETIEITIAYDGTDTYTVAVLSTGTLPPDTTRISWALSVPIMYGNSTKAVSDVPIYIDCDLGEAYIIIDGAYVSLNHRIDLGSDLPTLGVGANEVTFDNTITELKITPRFWKV